MVDVALFVSMLPELMSTPLRPCILARLQTLWRKVPPLTVDTPIWDAGPYDVPVLDLPDSIMALGPSAINIFQQVKDMYTWGTTEVDLQISSFKDVWANWDETERRKFHGR